MNITYAHKADPTGQRFRQHAFDRIPAWAVDVQDDDSTDPLTYEQQAAQAMADLPPELQSFVRTRAYDQGHSAGEDETNMIMAGMAHDLQDAFNYYLKRVGK